MELETLIPWIILGAGGLFGLILLFASFYTVQQGSEAVVERFGKFVRKAGPGLNLKIPIIESVSGINTQVQQLDVDVETKTKDNVFVKLKVGVQFNVIDAAAATYKLANSKQQISSYVFDVVRAQVPSLTLDQVFEKKDDIADAVKTELAEAMDDFGYGIVKALVTDIDPDEKVKAAMNEINAATRQRQAATEKAEAEKILLVKRAEAEAESKALQGKGIADERKAIVNGLRESVADFSSATGQSESEVMGILMMTQYFDTLKSLGREGTHTIMLPSGPQAVGDFQNQITAALQVQGNNVKKLK